MSFIKIHWWIELMPSTKGNIFFARCAISHMTVWHLVYLQQIAANRRKIFRNASSCGSSFKALLLKSLSFGCVPQTCRLFFPSLSLSLLTLTGPSHCWCRWRFLFSFCWTLWRFLREIRNEAYYCAKSTKQQQAYWIPKWFLLSFRSSMPKSICVLFRCYLEKL